MKIKDLFTQILEEQIANKKLFNALLEKWRVDSPDITETEVEKLFNRFQQIKTNLNPNLPQVISFLYRFDGNFGYPSFNKDDLKDITKYTHHQIKSLIDEYTPIDDLEEIEDNTIFNDKVTDPTTEKIQASKDLWFGDRYCILNLPGFRVYDIPDQSTAVKFGYYSETILKQLHGVYIWCVARRKDHKLGNLWELYRNDNKRSFYFVIDESRSPEVNTNNEENKYYVSALQYDDSSNYKYRITSVLNDGDHAYNWNEVVNKYPQLREMKQLIVNKPFSNKELEEQSVFSSISENPGKYEFRRISKGLKKLFINNGGVLTKPESWTSMDKELRFLYISSINKDNFLTKIPSYSFLAEIKKIGSDFSSLNNRLTTIGKKGVSDLFKYFIDYGYYIARTSKDNPNIKLYKSKSDGKFGLYDLVNGDWVTKNGVYYDGVFKIIKNTSIKDDKNVPYIVEIYSKTSMPDDHSFYALSPLDATSTTKSFFLTASAYNKLTEKMSEVEIRNKKVNTLQDFDPTSDVDIKEIEKGV